jgi:polysaccharide biosynthesis transport protein
MQPNAAKPEPSLPRPQADPDLSPIAGRIETIDDRPRPSTPPGLSATPDFAALMRCLRRRWMVAFTLGTLLAGLAALATYCLLGPSYTAFAQIRVLPFNPTIGARDLEPTTTPLMYLRSQSAMIRSRPILQKALAREEIKRLGLDSKHTDAVAYLEANLTVEVADNSDLMSVRFTSDDPNEAVTIVKAITDAYMDNLGYGEKLSRKNREVVLEGIYNETLEKIKTKKEQLKKRATTFGGLDKETLTRQREEVMGNIRDLRSQRLAIRMEMGKAKAQLESQDVRVKALQEVDRTESALDQALEADPVGRVARSKIDRLETIIRDFESSSSNPNQPTLLRAKVLLRDQVKILEARRQELRVDTKRRQEDKAAQEIRLTKIELNHQIEGLTDRLTKVDKEVKDQGEELAKLVGTINDEAQQQEIVLLEKSAFELGDRLTHLRVELNSPDRISLYQEADLMPKDSKKQLLGMIGSPVAVLFMVCMGVAWTDFRKRRIYSASEVSQGLGLRVVGSIPDVPNLEQHMLEVETDPALLGHPVVESIDSVRTMLLHDADQEETRVVLVSSAGSSEGKTTVAGHLASSLARAGRKTLLIDGDLRRPFLHEVFGGPMQPGFSEVLLCEVEAADGVQETAQENLDVMAAGQWDREVIHALARHGLSDLLEQLRDSYDFVIIDSHPILEAADSLLMSQHVDAVMLTVLRQVSQMPRVYTAYQRLTALQVRVLGVVVNGVDPNEVVMPAGSVPAGAGQNV